MSTTLFQVDASIKGDPDRGVVGITQHLESMVKGHKDHIAEDERDFNFLKAAQQTTRDEVNAVKAEIGGFKKWIAGAFFVGSLVATAIAFFIKIAVDFKTGH